MHCYSPSPQPLSSSSCMGVQRSRVWPQVSCNDWRLPHTTSSPPPPPTGIYLLVQVLLHVHCTPPCQFFRLCVKPLCKKGCVERGKAPSLCIFRAVLPFLAFPGGVPFHAYNAYIVKICSPFLRKTAEEQKIAQMPTHCNYSNNYASFWAAPRLFQYWVAA